MKNMYRLAYMNCLVVMYCSPKNDCLLGMLVRLERLDLDMSNQSYYITVLHNVYYVLRVLRNALYYMIV